MCYRYLLFYFKLPVLTRYGKNVSLSSQRDTILLLRTSTQTTYITASIQRRKLSSRWSPNRPPISPRDDPASRPPDETSPPFVCLHWVTMACFFQRACRSRRNPSGLPCNQTRHVMSRHPHPSNRPPRLRTSQKRSAEASFLPSLAVHHVFAAR